MTSESGPQRIYFSASAFSLPNAAAVPLPDSNSSSNCSSPSYSPQSDVAQCGATAPGDILIPAIPPRDCPLQPVPGPNGEDTLPTVSSNPVDVEHALVHAVLQHSVEPEGSCAACEDDELVCEFTETGISCGPCAVRSNENCSFAQPRFLLENAADWRNDYLHDQVHRLMREVQLRRLRPEQFAFEYRRSLNHSYAILQGAFRRFQILRRASRCLTQRGYRCLIASSTDVPQLGRFIEFGGETGLDKAVLKRAGERVAEIASGSL
uniref:Zn(2)-C6 fungal-type domain-containing protein n=1 Tax=Mycena chlorophos TaxID=658473 RepID=A0ABQ0LWB3_MYCCL|nr:predicted protein [Mycena chlorophos]